MKQFAPILFCLLLFSCSKSQKEESPPMQEPETIAISPKETEAPEKPQYPPFTEETKAAIDFLEQQYAEVPFYTIQNNSSFFIVSDKRYDQKMKGRFLGLVKYGIAAKDGSIRLQVGYDRISNPDLAIKNCFEIEVEGKTGLYNYTTGQILSPIFQYILPSKGGVSHTAYGFSGGRWFKIDSKKMAADYLPNFNPTPILKNISFDVLSIGNSMMLNSHGGQYDQSFNVGRGVVIPPSYVQKLGLMQSDSYTEVILPEQKHLDAGVNKAFSKIESEQSIGDQIKAFFVAAYESGIDARGYTFESQKLVLYNQESQEVKASELGRLTELDYFCRELSTRVIDAALVEVKTSIDSHDPASGNNHPENFDRRYNFETVYYYYQIADDGSIQPLESNRYYDCSKFARMDESYFSGCFGVFGVADDFPEGNNIWKSDHLSIADLDLMRNEIFAEYGYKFKSEEWQRYFEAKPWYKPLHEDVSDQLTDIDKANLDLILKVKEKMEGNEKQFTKKRPETYHAAG